MQLQQQNAERSTREAQNSVSVYAIRHVQNCRPGVACVTNYVGPLG